MRFLITQVISSTVELKRNEWMTVFTFCDGDLRKAGLDSLPVKLTTGRAKNLRGEGSLSDPLLAPRGTQCRGTVAFRILYYLFFLPGNQHEYQKTALGELVRVIG